MRLAAAGASVRDPAHEQDGSPNQDAVSVRGCSGGRFIAVADGLGSRRFSHIGSKRAVALAYEVMLERNTTFPNADVPSRLSRNWRRVFSGGHDDYETTCLWASVDGGGQGMVGQAGDGLALIRSQ